MSRRRRDTNRDNLARVGRPQELRDGVDRRGSGGVGDRMAEIFERPKRRRRKAALGSQLPSGKAARHRADAKSAAEPMGSTPVDVRLARQPLGDGLELWSLNGVATVMPAVEPDMSPELRQAIEIRALANVIGRCICGGTVSGGRPVAPGLGQVAIAHALSCPAADETIEPMLTAYRDAMGVRDGRPTNDRHARPERSELEV
jgi:hypothetical protein